MRTFNLTLAEALKSPGTSLTELRQIEREATEADNREIARQASAEIARRKELVR